MSLYRESINKIEKYVSRFSISLDIAFRLRRFSNAVIYHSLYPERDMDVVSDMEFNGEIEFLKVAAPDVKSFMDVGANVGEWTDQLLSYAGSDIEGFLYEPSKSAMEKLEARFGRDSRLVLSPAALGDDCGMATFHEEPAAGQTASLLEGVSIDSAKEVTVPLTTLDNEFDKRGISFIDILKIDAEGYDGRILKGAKTLISQHRFGIIQFEYNTSWLKARFTLAEALNLLEDGGYSTYLLTKGKLGGYDYEKYNEFFNYAVFIAISSEKSASFDLPLHF